MQRLIVVRLSQKVCRRFCTKVIDKNAINETKGVSQMSGELLEINQELAELEKKILMLNKSINRISFNVCLLAGVMCFYVTQN